MDGDPQSLEDLMPPEAPPLAVAESCARCHGFRGGARGDGAFPRIDGQRREYLYAALEAYARHTRPSGIMGPIAAGLEPAAWAGWRTTTPRVPTATVARRCEPRRRRAPEPQPR